jgi:hypothetical protein
MGAMDHVAEDRKTHLELLATIVINKVASGDVADAFAKIQKEKFDSDETTALWSLLDSKTRSALKKHGESLKTTKEAVAA